ncbi:hypothetical protein, partial [Klebsiella pneumoniae]|uniref:hypothetical protein n=1 Tax=Klebsiella pneumoniae TaxID=573 RepID=UPI00163D80E5
YFTMAAKDQLDFFAEKFNQLSKSNLLTTKKCSDLQEKKHYALFTMKKLETSVGEAVVAVLGDSPYKEGDIPKFQIYLPKRLVNFLMNEDLDSIKPGMFYIVSHGSSANNSTEITLHVNNVL